MAHDAQSVGQQAFPSCPRHVARCQRKQKPLRLASQAGSPFRWWETAPSPAHTAKCRRIRVRTQCRSWRCMGGACAPQHAQQNATRDHPPGQSLDRRTALGAAALHRVQAGSGSSVCAGGPATGNACMQLPQHGMAGSVKGWAGMRLQLHCSAAPGVSPFHSAAAPSSAETVRRVPRMPLRAEAGKGRSWCKCGSLPNSTCRCVAVPHGGLLSCCALLVLWRADATGLNLQPDLGCGSGQQGGCR